MKTPPLTQKLAVFAAILLLPAAAFAAVYSAGHADFGVAYEDNDWFVHYHFDASSIIDGSPLGSGHPPEAYEFDPASIQIEVPLAARQTVGSTVPFLGNAPGGDVWILSQNNVSGQPYFGLATEELLAADWLGNIRFELTAFTGPGNFSMWSTGSFGEANVKFQTNNGVSAADFEAIPTGTHAHYNWGFTAPGLYEADITVTGMHATDGLQTSTKTLVFHVVPEPSTMAFGLIGMVAMAFRRHRIA